ncbi:MAG: DUF3667 domain-containing protein [Muribaculaceae bacterium]|nr:DUF3667 domain-containing protein [Muribaculaceae bacterium]
MCNKQENTEINADIITETVSETPSETPDGIATNSAEEIAIETSIEGDSEEDEGYSLDKCLNCGTVLNGKWCHNCGQHITDHAMTVKQFILSYLDNTYLWDPQQFKTIWKLISRPGLLTKEYIAGKFVSQVQPLKLNMFLLVVFLTIFVFFGSDKRINNTMQEITHDEMMFASLQMDEISNDEGYLEKIKTSPRDTVNLIAPIFLAEKYPTIISAHKVFYNSDGKALDQWVSIVPHVFIEEEIIKTNDDGCYRFNTETGIAAEDIAMFKAVWDQMSTFSLQYFPIIILLTAPILAFSLRVVQRKRKRTYFTHFIFSMHYIAFVELIIIVLYLLYLIMHPSITLLNYIFTIFSCIYFARSFRVVYETTWFRSITKAILSNVIYYIICLSVFVTIFFITCMVVAMQFE